MKHILRISILLIALSSAMMVSAASGIDWEKINWVPENGNTNYKEKYKVSQENNQPTIVNIQNSNDNKLSIYVHVPAAINECSVASTILGAGVWLHLSAFTAKETQVTIKYEGNNKSCTFWVYYADGNAGTEEENPDDTGNTDPTEGICTYVGIAGDGLTRQPGRDPFTTGYEVSLQLDNKHENIMITATTKDGDATSAIFQNYYTYIEKEANNEKRMEGTNTSKFTVTIPLSDIHNREDGIIRFAIKFEYPNGVIKVTTPEFFYLDGSGCAQRVFAIYHHDDPFEERTDEDQFREFEGGKILQSIQYKRLLTPDKWETLCVPFDVDSVTVYDPSSDTNYLLHARYNNGGTTVEGHYWLRYFSINEVSATNFQSNWRDINATSEVEAMPQKDKAYIIRVPAGDFYANKYLVFHGKGYQTIASEFNAPTPPAQDDYYSYSANNTMMPQTLASAYVLDNTGYYFYSLNTVTLHPFECSVNATAATVARMPRLALNDKNRTTTDIQDLPSTDLSQGSIYSIYGTQVASFQSLEQYDHILHTLPAGVYIIATSSHTTKIQILP